MRTIYVLLYVIHLGINLYKHLNYIVRSDPSSRFFCFFNIKKPTKMIFAEVFCGIISVLVQSGFFFQCLCWDSSPLIEHYVFLFAESSKSVHLQMFKVHCKYHIFIHGFLRRSSKG